MSTKPAEITMRPGINKNTTDYANEGKWVDGDKVRFRNNRPEKIGGWLAELSGSTSIDGTTRDLLTWIDLDQNSYVALGTHKKLQLFNSGNYIDITPITKTVNPPTSVNTVNTSSIVTMEITSHGASVGDSIFIRNSSGAVGTTINLAGEYVVTEVVDSDNFKFDATTVATSTSANPGWTGDIDFLLEIGFDSNTPLFGYGSGGYGQETYGTPRTTAVTGALRQWKLDNFGENLIACLRGGNLYEWVANTGTSVRAATIANAPAENLFSLVSDQARHLISFGCSDFSGNLDPMLVRWSSSENITDWTPVSTNTSGSFPLSSGVSIIGAVQTKREILIFTNSSVYSMRYIGGDLVFAIDEISTASGLVAPHATVDVEGRSYWMGQNAFYIHDGTTRTMKCDLQKAIFSPDDPESVNQDQLFKVHAGVNSEYQEVWWFYPSLSSEENDRYIIYNYEQDIWYDGNLERTAWEDSNVFERPIATDTTNLFSHELGKNDDAAVMTSFLQSGDLEIGEGDELMFVDRFVPDFVLTGVLQFTLFYRKYPQDAYQSKGPFNITSSTSKQNFRARGRQVAVRYESSETNGDWEAGKLRLFLGPNGRR